MNEVGGQQIERLEDIQPETPVWPPDPIVTDPAVLAQVSRSTSWEEVQALGLVPRLMQILNRGWCPSVGYAAIQIGIPLRMALYVPARISRGESKNPVVLINPVILSKKNIKPFQKEGCMSIPNQRQATWRYDEVVLTSDTSGKPMTFTVQGFEAAVIQHEIDHMDGILNLQRVKKPVEPGANDTCGCGSGLKFKRCCR